ncbi:hypothetical protein GYMLUDRAFT_41041 [Collybiopsis luxurians FD-317 M1]|uniref:Uncharacterized protein n=1 Tax=Collybiopsis luxurians FD-317 M1 TaxID=944289 RepID=A0A0D0CKA8_9AGAR|nr:hypothetical protein GYMLUDRAFT_41041 [Collybiopsis luxurians FD-317 M1]
MLGYDEFKDGLLKILMEGGHIEGTCHISDEMDFGTRSPENFKEGLMQHWLARGRIGVFSGRCDYDCNVTRTITTLLFPSLISRPSFLLHPSSPIPTHPRASCRPSNPGT